MATKRKITVKIPPPEGEETDEDLKPVILRRDRGWRDWFISDYLRYWYFLGCLLGDAFIALEVRDNIDTGLSILVPLIVITALAAAEFLVYRSLWGSEGRWAKE